MELQKCVKCNKRPAAVYITRLEGGKSVNEGLCLVCARALGIKPIEDMLKRMGVSDEDIENMSNEVEGLMNNAEGLSELAPTESDDEDGGAPAIDLPKIFGSFGMPFPPMNIKKKEKDAAKDKTAKEGGSSHKLLNTYCTNLTARAKSGTVDRIVGRDRELDRVIQILCRRQKNNPCLIGEPGVGKTAIAEALAQKIADGEVPERLADSEIWLLDLTALVAGTQFRGQFEQRILGLIREVKAAGNIILMIDEVHNIVGAGDSEGSMSAANILKPALSRGEIQVIGATTLREYRKYIEKDSALERRFQPVTVSEPSIDDAEEIIRGIKKYYEDFHEVKIPTEIARSAVTLSERYITDRFLPDKAIDLIDEAAARRALTSAELNERQRNEKRLATLRAAREALEGKIDPSAEGAEEKYRELADIKMEEARLTERQEAIASMVSELHITLGDLARVIEIWTGVPATDIERGEIAELSGLHGRISERIIGQDEAVSAVVRAVKRRRAGISYQRKPVSMIFAGPTGVGKTELVKVLARELFKQPEALIRLDMSEFMEKHSVSRIIGAPPGYVGYDEAGQLTEKIRRRPYAVILFDEIEKAHPDVLNILLQILDDGRITDAQGRQVNFENTVIIMTTNAGSERASAVSGFVSQKETKTSERTERALFGFLRPEFINRIDEIITFRHLDREDFKRIAALGMRTLAEFMRDEKGIRITYDDEVLSLIAEKSYSEKFGARNMRRYIERSVEDLLAEAIIENLEASLLGAHFYVEDEKIKIKTI